MHSFNVPWKFQAIIRSWSILSLSAQDVEWDRIFPAWLHHCSTLLVHQAVFPNKLFQYFSKQLCLQQQVWYICCIKRICLLGCHFSGSWHWWPMTDFVDFRIYQLLYDTERNFITNQNVTWLRLGSRFFSPNSSRSICVIKVNIWLALVLADTH